MKSNSKNIGMGLYVHVPFCIKKCAYCDFYSLSLKSLHENYIDALNKQMKNLSKVYSDRFFDTVYIGGGTPTILDAQRLGVLLTSIFQNFNIDKSAEITIEANPATLDNEKLEALLSGGVNRLSIGCQSAVDFELKTLGRSHSFAEFVETYELARSAGFDNISVDLMYAIPDQTLETFKYSLESVARLAPEHISLYGLKIEPNTLFYKNRDKLAFPGEDEFCQMYLEAGKYLSSMGYSKYEISNFSKAGYESRHNMKYWKMQDYLGLGPGAHSFVNCRRFAYSRDVLGYTKAVNEDREPDYSENSIISANDLLNEEFMLNMRLITGYDMDGRLALDEEKLSLFEKHGYIARQNNNIRFTDNGFLVSNYLLSELTNFD